ncbi:MAG TPA: hypothetical protein VGG19_09610 [Tepidisphaeraceae bacterium]
MFRRRVLSTLLPPAILVALIILILHRALFSGGQFVPSWPDTDLFLVYLPWRYFGFSQWKLGHFPFWNPHVFCGIPFFAQIQSTLFYPIAWVHFLLNVASAATWEMALNLSAGAICMYAWARQRGIGRWGAILSGAVFAFSGPFYAHVIVGYLTVLASLAWMPLVFLAVDRLLIQSNKAADNTRALPADPIGGLVPSSFIVHRSSFSSGILIGSIALCLQCLGGHIQLVYYTLIIAALYLLLHSTGKPHILRLYAAFAAMCCLGVALAAFQLLPSYFATQLSVRAGGTSYAFASQFSLPPENLLSILIPYPFGDIANAPYMGRWHLWEMTLYAGVVSLVLACVGLATLERSRRWRIILLLAVILLLTLGSYTPVFWALYHYLPGFNLFRGASKFAALWTLMLAILAGHGWQRIQRAPLPRRTITIIVIACALCAFAGIIIAESNPRTGPVSRLLSMVYHSDQYYIDSNYFLDPSMISKMTTWMARQWLITAALLASTSLLLFLRRFWTMPAYLLLALAIFDVYTMAAEITPLQPSQISLPNSWAPAATNATEHDQRILVTNSSYDNLGELLGYNAIWGYDTGQPTRYTNLIAASQDQHPLAADAYRFLLLHDSKLFRLLRCRYIMDWVQAPPLMELHDPLPHLLLIGAYEKTSRTSVSQRLLNPDFDFTRSAILESDPAICPTPAGATGSVKLLRQSINDLEIQADLPSSALLLITDAYAPGWDVQPIESNPEQENYQVLRADDVLRAIPLAAGHHHFDLYYFPPGLKAGAIISIAGWITWATIAAWTFVIGMRRRPVLHLPT